MFDKSVFTESLNKESECILAKIKDKFEIIWTHIQEDEASNNKNEYWTEKDLEIIRKLKDKTIHTNGFVLGVSMLADADDENKKGGIMKNNYELQDKIYNACFNRKKENSEENAWRDSLVTSTCVESNIILITNDKKQLKQLKENPEFGDSIKKILITILLIKKNYLFL